MVNFLGGTRTPQVTHHYKPFYSLQTTARLLVVNAIIETCIAM